MQCSFPRVPSQYLPAAARRNIYYGCNVGPGSPGITGGVLDASRHRGPKVRFPCWPQGRFPCPLSPDQVTITLPDGKAATPLRGVTGGEIAAAIGPEHCPKGRP